MSLTPESISKGWYLARSGSCEGPVESADILSYLQSGEMSWLDYAAHPIIENGDWKRIFELGFFQQLWPPKPKTQISASESQSINPATSGQNKSSTDHLLETKNKKLFPDPDEDVTCLNLKKPVDSHSLNHRTEEQSEIQNLEDENVGLTRIAAERKGGLFNCPEGVSSQMATASSVELAQNPGIMTAKGQTLSDPKKQTWYVQFDGSKYGPMMLGEIEIMLDGHRSKDIFYVWRKGFESWMKIASRGDLLKLSGGAQTPATAPTSKRKKQRFNVMATIESMDPFTKRKIKGICRDVSLGGMQVLIDTIPGPTGSEHEFEVTPYKNVAVSPFKVRGVIRRILPAMNGFGFEFIALPEKTRLELEKVQKAE